MMLYLIIPSSELANVDFTQLVTDSAETARQSLDQTKALLKYEGETPSVTGSEGPYTHDEIQTILATDSWETLVAEMVGDFNPTPRTEHVIPDTPEDWNQDPPS